MCQAIKTIHIALCCGTMAILNKYFDDIVIKWCNLLKRRDVNAK